MLRCNVLSRSFASLLSLPRILACKTKLDTMRARMLAITLRPELIALIACAADPSPYRLSIGASLATLRSIAFVFLPNVLSAPTPVAIAVPMLHLWSCAIEWMSLLLLHLLHSILRSLCERIQARSMLMLQHGTLRDTMSSSKAVRVLRLCITRRQHFPRSAFVSVVSRSAHPSAAAAAATSTSSCAWTYGMLKRTV